MTTNNSTASRATVQQLLQQMPEWKEQTSPGSHKVLSRIERCRTADLGYHAYRCTDSDCGAMQYVYHPSFIGTVATVTAPGVATVRRRSG